MTRKHYSEVAEIIKSAMAERLDSEVSPYYAQGWFLSYVACGLADMFQQDNPRFDRDKFMEACFTSNNHQGA